MNRDELEHQVEQAASVVAGLRRQIARAAEDGTIDMRTDVELRTWAESAHASLTRAAVALRFKRDVVGNMSAQELADLRELNGRG